MFPWTGILPQYRSNVASSVALNPIRHPPWRMKRKTSTQSQSSVIGGMVFYAQYDNKSFTHPLISNCSPLAVPDPKKISHHPHAHLVENCSIFCVHTIKLCYPSFHKIALCCCQHFASEEKRRNTIIFFNILIITIPLL